MCANKETLPFSINFLKNILSLFKNQVFLFDPVTVMFSGEYQNQKTR